MDPHRRSKERINSYRPTTVHNEICSRRSNLSSLWRNLSFECAEAIPRHIVGAVNDILSPTITCDYAMLEYRRKGEAQELEGIACT